MMKTLFERYVVKDWKLKLLSLVLAIMLWYTVFQIGEPKKDITVPLSVSHLPRNMVLMKMDPERVFVTVSGRVSMLKDVKERDVTAIINLNGMKEGETVFEISKANVALPKGIDIVDVKPGTVRVVVDRVIEKRLKVVPVLDRKWTGRYDITLASPEYIVAEGPRKILESVATVETLPANGELRRVEETVNVGFNTESLPHVRVRPDSARIVLRRHPGKEVHWD
ncbi:MAG: YbbR-like protein [Syntrophorhabdus sp. PtaB.Bin047]|jgi:YbbR domain-containing protein|nr:MAG: YbbR-like protein [Syntrophorhabdus sp. PtaB.Bin047]